MDLTDTLTIFSVEVISRQGYSRSNLSTCKQEEPNISKQQNFIFDIDILITLVETRSPNDQQIYTFHQQYHSERNFSQAKPPRNEISKRPSIILLVNHIVAFCKTSLRLILHRWWLLKRKTNVDSVIKKIGSCRKILAGVERIPLQKSRYAAISFIVQLVMSAAITLLNTFNRQRIGRGSQFRSARRIRGTRPWSGPWKRGRRRVENYYSMWTTGR